MFIAVDLIYMLTQVHCFVCHEIIFHSSTCSHTPSGRTTYNRDQDSDDPYSHNYVIFYRYQSGRHMLVFLSDMIYNSTHVETWNES